jgi:hypothetical protein
MIHITPHPTVSGHAHPSAMTRFLFWSTRMPRRLLLRIVASMMAAAAVLLLAVLVMAGVESKAHPPRDEVRIEKILDFQLPDV